MAGKMECIYSFVYRYFHSCHSWDPGLGGWGGGGGGVLLGILGGSVPSCSPNRDPISD